MPMFDIARFRLTPGMAEDPGLLPVRAMTHRRDCQVTWFSTGMVVVSPVTQGHHHHLLPTPDAAERPAPVSASKARDTTPVVEDGGTQVRRTARDVRQMIMDTTQRLIDQRDADAADGDDDEDDNVSARSHHAPARRATVPVYE